MVSWSDGFVKLKRKQLLQPALFLAIALAYFVTVC